MRLDLRGRAEADRLADLLEGRIDPADAAEPDQALVDLAEALRAVAPPEPTIREEFRTDLRASLVEAAREQRAATRPPLLTRIREGTRRMRYSSGFATGMSATALAMSGGGVAVAAEYAQPDQALYDIKLALEDLRLTLTLDTVARGDRALAYAFDRLEETERAVGEGRDGAAATALDNAGERVITAGDLMLEAGLVDPVIRLAEGLQDQMDVLDRLDPLFGPEAAAAADALRTTITEVAEALQDAVDPSDWPAIDLPSLPVLPTPEQVLPDVTATPVPEITLPPVEDGVDLLPDGGDDPLLPLPELPGLPTLPLPEATLPQPSLPQPSVPQPSLPQPSVPQPDEPLAPVTDGVQDAVEGIGDGLESTIDGIGSTVDGAGPGLEETVGGVVETVPDPVQSALPAPVQETVDELPGTVGDVIETVPEVLDPVGDALGSVGGTIGGLSR